MTVSLRPAQNRDMRQVFEWRNDPFIIERSSSKRIVEWEEHEAWFMAALIDPNKKIYVVVENNQEIGLIRFDRTNTKICMVSAYLLKPFIGRGWGATAIRLGCNLICECWLVNCVIAYVRKENVSGAKGFLKAGFNPQELIECPEEHLALVWNCGYVADIRSSTWKSDDEKNVTYYSELINRYGIDSRSLNWGSSSSQLLRFKVLAEVVPLVGLSLLDVGCGLGDLCSWLESQNIKVGYFGIDIVPDMIELATKRFPNGKFELLNLLECKNDIERKDVVVASGIFAKRTQNPGEYFHAMIKAMFDISAVAVAFNSLSTWSTEKESGEFYADPLETVTYCKTLTPWVTVRHDYHARDFTIYMYRERNV